MTMEDASGDAALTPPRIETVPTHSRVLALRAALDALERISREDGQTEHALAAFDEIAHDRSIDEDPELGEYLTELRRKARKFHCVKGAMARHLLFDVEENRLKHEYDELRAWLFNQISSLHTRLQQATTEALPGAR
jgi:hypothetical protein